MTKSHDTTTQTKDQNRINTLHLLVLLPQSHHPLLVPPPEVDAALTFVFTG